MLTIKFPEYTGSDAITVNGMASVTVPTTLSAVKVGNADLGVKLDAGSPTGLPENHGAFTVWSTSSTAPTTLSVEIFVDTTKVAALHTFNGDPTKPVKIGGTDYYWYSASWTSLSTPLTAGKSITAKWRSTGGGTLTLYNAVLSVVATDWGDGLTR